MPKVLLLRPLTEEEVHGVRRLAQSQKGEARLRERARICWCSHQRSRVREIMTVQHLDERTVRRWIHWFNAQEMETVIATSLTLPDELELPFGS